MQVTVRWEDGVSFKGQSPSGHVVTMDGPPDSGGRNLGFRPMETLLLGVGGCSSFDVVTILNKSRQSVTGCELDIQAQRVDSTPAVFRSIQLDFRISGENLKDKLVARAVKLSVENYCSAIAMLKQGGVEIGYSYRILEKGLDVVAGSGHQSS